MMFQPRSVLWDLADLRFAIFKGYTPMNDGSVVVFFYPLNASPFAKPHSITIKRQDALIPVPSPAQGRKEGTFEMNWILLENEQGESPFLEGRLNSEVPRLIRMMEELRKSQRISESAARTYELMMKQGEKKVLKDFAEKERIIESVRKREEEKRRRSQSFSDIISSV